MKWYELRWRGELISIILEQAEIQNGGFVYSLLHASMDPFLGARYGLKDYPRLSEALLTRFCWRVPRHEEIEPKLYAKCSVNTLFWLPKLEIDLVGLHNKSVVRGKRWMTSMGLD